MLSLEVVGPGDGLSTVPSQAATATAAYSCDRTVAALFHRLGNGWQWHWRCGTGFRWRWAQDLLYSFIFTYWILISLYSAFCISLYYIFGLILIVFSASCLTYTNFAVIGQ